MLIVGLTGGIASGKSTVSRLLHSQHGIPIIDLDVLAREVVQPGTSTLRALVDAFGREILQADGSLDRPALGRIAFNDERKRKILNTITHSAIRKRMMAKLVRYWVTGTKVVVVDTPLLVEAGLWAWCGEMVLVYCSYEDQLARMLKRDGSSGLTEADAKSRLAAQLPLPDKIPYADVVLDNTSAPEDSGDPTATSKELRKQVKDLVAKWQLHTAKGLGRVFWFLEWAVPPVGVLIGLVTVYLRRRRVAYRRHQAKTLKSRL